jgi:nitric oxide reductase large subunit
VRKFTAEKNVVLEASHSIIASYTHSDDFKVWHNYNVHNYYSMPSILSLECILKVIMIAIIIIVCTRLKLFKKHTINKANAADPKLQTRPPRNAALTTFHIT